MNIIFKKIYTHLFSQRTNLHASSLAYSSILAFVPALIISISLFKIISNIFPLLEHPYISKTNSFLNSLNLTNTSSLLINIICLNLLSSTIFSLLTTFEELYKFNFQNYLKKKLYSLLLSFIIILLIIISLSLSFTISIQKNLSSINIVIDFVIIQLSLLIFYKLATFQKIKKLYIGATLSSIFLTIFLHFFYYIITIFSNLKSYYGILTPAMILLLIIYYSCYIIYFGILVNYETAKISRIKKIKK